MMKYIMLLCLAVATILVWNSVSRLKKMEKSAQSKIAELVVLSKAVDAMASGRDYEIRAISCMQKLKTRFEDPKIKNPTKDEVIKSLVEVNTNLVYSNQEYKTAVETLMSIQKFPSESISTNSTSKEN